MSTDAATTNQPTQPTTLNAAQRFFPWVTALLALVMIAVAFTGRQIEGPYDWEAFGELPVSASGRVKPLDTVARNTLMVITGRQTIEIDEDTKHEAIRWCADVIANAEIARTQDVFRIDHPELVAMLGFESPEQGGKKRFSFMELTPSFEEISRQADLAFQVKPKERDPFQRQVIDLMNRLTMYISLEHVDSPYLIPPLAEGEEWRPLASALFDPAQQNLPAVLAWREILLAYADDKPDEFNAAVESYRELLAPTLGGALTKSKYEVVFNEVKPFYQAMVIYIAAFLIAGFGFLLSCMERKAWSRSLWKAMMLLLTIAFIVHTSGLVVRIILQGRPPVTNLYSSAVFIGWAVALIGIFLERIFKISLAGMATAVIGFATLIVAHNLANTGDTMEMMQAVLDSNFWLATHVIVVTIGYSATFLAGFLAIVYILLGVPTNVLRGDGGKALMKMIYGVICFATITSFVGTVLGGIWADQSWGRFWGWDPKENGAALIVLMNLIILHARWGGMIRERGIAVLAVGGNIITSWSWFGTNMLGVGLHSYGFIDSAVFWMLLFVASQLIVMGVGLTPWRFWRSFRKDRPAAAKPKQELHVSPQPAIE